ncbi:hypothetical protein ACJ73_03188 [Blastomyces percursus]|uniref:Chromo domain-containing protein n=1 Tax=Blastomyces percursus TaxID=1658174 RepID=A0A1J9QBK4_9EURO|nr:hypothetical protein ACJ73_03188 [Blastomyces percursus]
MTSKEASTGAIDDDDISVTSTVGSEPRSEYEVESILAQKSFANGDAYLVKWAGYPLERATWEPEESFCDPTTLVEWRKKIASGEHQSLDVDVEALARRIEEIENAKLDRRRRRRAKRIRLGLAVSPSTDSSSGAYDSGDSDSDLDGFIVGDDFVLEGENGEEGWQSLRRKRQRSSNNKVKHGAAMTAPLSLSHRDQSKSQVSSSIRLPSTEFTNKTNKCDATSAARAPATNLKSAQSTKPVSPTKQMQTSKKLQKASTRHEARPILNLKTSSSTDPSSHALLSPAQGQAPSCSSPRQSVSDPSQVPGPLTPTGPANRSVSIRAMKQTGPNSTFFRNLSSKNRYEKAMRRDLTPDIRQLELRSPGEWIASQNSKTQVSESPSDLRITPNLESLFVEQDQPDHEANSRRHSHDSPTRIEGSTEARSSFRLNQAQRASGQPSSKLSHEGSLNSYNSETSIIRSSAFSPRGTGPVKPSHHATPRGIQGTGGRFRSFQPTEVLAHLRFGPESKEIGDVRLGGLTKTSIWQLVLLKSQNRIDIHFKNVCNLDQYRQLCDRRQNKKYCNGWVLGYDDTSTAVNEVANYLRDNRLAALWYHPKDDIPTVIVAYASDCPDWSFLNGSDADPHARLRIAVRSGLSPFSSLRPVSAKETPYHAGDAGECSAGGEENYFNMNPQPMESMTQQDGNQFSLSKRLSAANSPMDIVSIFRERFGITYDELSIVNTSKNARSFYLHFPREAEDEFQQVLLFLKHYDMVFFSNRIEGDWERFVKTVTTGTVLFHQKFIHYENLPMLSKLLRAPVNVFSISLAEPIKYLDHDSHLQRLFPHGGIVLMTEDFMLKAPEAALNVLSWFGDFIRRKFRGTWKMFLRPNVQRWLSDICVSWPDDTLWQMYLTINSLIPKYPVGHYNAYRREDSPDSLDGLTDDEGQHHPFISTRDIPDYGSRREDDHPNIPKGLTQEERDADHLIEYFAGYALINADRFRRFAVLTTHKPQPRWQAWTHIEVMHYPDFKRKFMTASAQGSASKSSGGKNRNRDRDRDNKGGKVPPTKRT